MKAKKHPGRGSKLRYPRIVGAAKELGVSRTHLTAVLNGERKGRSGLVEEYKRAAAAAGEKIKLHNVARYEIEKGFAEPRSVAEAAGKLKGRGRG